MMTIEDYLLSQLEEPVMVKNPTTGEAVPLQNMDGSVMTKQQAIAAKILNEAMKGDVKAAAYIQTVQTRAALNRKKVKRQ